MKAKPIRGRPIPRFASLDEESVFWDRHSPLDRGDWEAVPYEKVCEALAVRGEEKRSVTLRLEQELVRRLKTAARRHGIRYQALAREILWRSLLRKAQ